MSRPAKTLWQLVHEGTFRSRRESHRDRLLEPELPWPAFALLQRRYRAASSEPERRAITVEFEQAVQLVHQQATNENAGGDAGGGVRLRAELAQLGRAGSVQQLLRFIPAYLVHPKGPLRGEPFALEPWQKQFLREFYRRDKKGRRVYRLGLLGIPRGNGKTAFAAALALYELIARTDAPEIYFAAGSKDQAGIALSFARSFVEQGPLADWVSVKSKLLCPASGGLMEVLSSEGALQHGRAPATAIIDELWALATATQVESYGALTSALHKRVDSYLLAITTAGYDKRTLLGRIYTAALAWPNVTVSRNGCLTIAKDDENGMLLWWYAAPAEADLEDTGIWRAANPSSFVNLRDLKRQLHDPGLGELGFRRLHLNQWTTARDAWFDAGAWERLQSDEKIPPGAEVFIGVDVALSQDTTAVCWAHRKDDGQILLRARVWAARDDAAAHTHVKGGKVLLEPVEEFIRRLARKFSVREVAYDPRFFDRSAELLRGDGLAMVEFLQASAPMADAYQRFYQLVIEQKLAHNGDPVLAAHIDATAAHPSERGWKISKLRSPLVIDATVAATMAATRADINGAPKPGPQIFWIEP